VSSLEDLGLPDARIKWPNDIYYQGAKIAGILIENIVRANQLEWAVLGIGLNVNQMVYQVENATSISLESGCERDLLRVRKILLGRLNQYYQMLKMSAFHELRENYTRSLMWINQERTFRERGSDKTFQGIITMVTESGKLVIRNQQQETCYDFKEIVFIG
jgi:BirA family biotin operon repressor/biotin-[acetyl-CoA-carboxylase] ligase